MAGEARNNNFVTGAERILKQESPPQNLASTSSSKSATDFRSIGLVFIWPLKENSNFQNTTKAINKVRNEENSSHRFQGSKGTS